MKLIFAQGNSDKKYDGTRHNVGFSILDSFIEGDSGSWVSKVKFRADIYEITIDDEKIILAKPTTYYNETGVSARALIDFYSLDTATDVLVIHDDLALPFGTIRTRKQGSDAGNNGIKSLNAHIGKDYHRLRIGIWNSQRDQGNDAHFVLSRFSNDESQELKRTIIPHALTLIKQFSQGELEVTSHTL